MKSDWQKTQRELEDELARLERRRSDLDGTIAQLRHVVAWFQTHRIASDPPRTLADACRRALRATTTGMTPREVRGAVTRSGFNWTHVVHPDSAINAALKRLVARRDAATRVDDHGKRRFVWARTPWADDPRTQAEEAARIEHLLDGSVARAFSRAAAPTLDSPPDVPHAHRPRAGAKKSRGSH